MSLIAMSSGSSCSAWFHLSSCRLQLPTGLSMEADAIRQRQHFVFALSIGTLPGWGAHVSYCWESYLLRRTAAPKGGKDGLAQPYSQQHSRHEQIDLFCCSSVMIWLKWWLGLAQLSPTHTGPCRVCIIISSTRHQQHPGIGTCSHYNCSSMQSLSSVRDASALMVKAPQSVELNKRANLCPAVAFSSLFVCQSCQLDWDFPVPRHIMCPGCGCWEAGRSC